MKVPQSFLGLWGFIALWTLLLGTVLIAAVAAVSDGGWELVSRRLELGGALNALLGLPIFTAIIAAGVLAKNRRGKGPGDSGR